MGFHLLVPNIIEITVGSHDVTTANDSIETTVFTRTPYYGGLVWVSVDLATLIAASEGGTITLKLYHMIDEATLRLIDETDFVIGVDTVHPTLEGVVSHETASDFRLTIQCSDDVSVTRAVPYMLIEKV